MKRILMIANDIERWGPARLPEPLSKAGIEVAVLCQDDNPLHHSSFVKRHYTLAKLKSWRKFGTELAKVMADWKPDLVMPCDELVVVMLHYFLKRPKLAARYFHREQIAVLSRSLGRPDALDAMVLKQQTRLMAEFLRVPFPEAEVVSSVGSAQKVADRYGYPVFLKASFSWGGQGTIQCNDASELAVAFAQLNTKTSAIKSLARHFLARDWYYNTSAIEVQKAIPGESVMYSVAALDGKVLGGLFACRASRLGATGPSTVVSIGAHAECARSVEAMIAAMGASGFLAFDFMRCERTGKMFLLECNPRPNQIFHLGYKVGTDLCLALADGLNGLSSPPRTATGDATVPLFPQLWLRDETKALETMPTLDIPKNDHKLLTFMLKLGESRGLVKQRLLEAFSAAGRTTADYPFG